MYEKKIAELTKQLEDEHARFEGAEEQLDEAKNLLSCHQKPMQVCLKFKWNVVCLAWLPLPLLLLLNCILYRFVSYVGVWKRWWSLSFFVGCGFLMLSFIYC